MICSFFFLFFFFVWWLLICIHPVKEEDMIVHIRWRIMRNRGVCACQRLLRSVAQASCMSGPGAKEKWKLRGRWISVIFSQKGNETSLFERRKESTDLKCVSLHQSLFLDAWYNPCVTKSKCFFLLFHNSMRIDSTMFLLVWFSTINSHPF